MKEKLAAMQKALTESQADQQLERRVKSLEKQLWELFNDLGVFVAYVEEKLGQIPEEPQTKENV